jgi:hypothetical protein
MASSLNNAPWMEWVEKLMGGVSRQAYAATFPPDRFYCVLDELPLHLIPQRTLRALRVHNDQPLYLNPKCVLRPASELPDGLPCQKEVIAAFSLHGTIAWVPDVTGDLLPFWLGPRLVTLVRCMKPGDPAPPALGGQSSAVLYAARILLPSDEDDIRAHERDAALRKATVLFRARGYAPVSDLIHPFHIAALRRYYRYLIRSGAIRLGDKQSPRRYVAYNEPVARFFHQQIAKKVSAVAGELVKPSYVYLASYLSGAELKKHTDRVQCEFSVTLCLDFSPEPVLETPWPIELDTSSGTVKVYQSLGDGLAYRGTRLPHYRGVLGEGKTSTSIFFHYVSADFTGSLD